MLIPLRFTIILLSLTLNISAFIVKGATGGTNARGARPFRQEVTKMQRAGGPAWDLYILALERFQQMKQSDALSWYQFGGVHGFPAVDWDGVKATENPQSPGYASHNSVLFLPWHRVYLAAYEQLVQEFAKQIANQYPKNTQKRYKNAAETLRIPYWDWAASPSLPNVLTEGRITVNTPQGQRQIDNPMATYRFHPIPSSAEFPQDFPLSQAPQTRRTPDSNGNDQIASINAALQANGQTLTDKVYLLVARQSNFMPFSNTGYPAELRNGSYDSIESIHNQIHGLVGGNGHMSYVPFSSFDPVFWLHHTNIDRLWAIWSVIHPSSYVSPQRNAIGTYAQAPGTIEDASTPLYPFRSDGRGDFHTAVSARDTRTFGYSYPEVVDWTGSSDQVARSVRRAFKSLYNPTGVLDAQKRDLSFFMRRADGGGPKQDWFINIKVNRTLNYPISVNFFLGPPLADQGEWPTADNLISSQIILPDLSFGKVAPPSLAQIPLSRSLAAAEVRGQLNSTDTQSVQSFLAAQLQWTITTSTGQMIAPRNLTELQISIRDQQVESASETEGFGSFGELNNHTELSWTSGP